MHIFFGWFIVAAAVAILGYHSSMFVYGLTAFLTPIAAASGWTYTQISLGTSLRGLEIGALDPIAGLVVDRWPARRLMILGTIVFVIGTILISRTTNLAVFYAGFLIVGLGSAFCHNIVPMTVIARWFRKRIGLASGILSMGFSIGGLFVPFLVMGIDAFGWQDMMMYMAFGALALGLPLSLLFRNRPEEHGMLPDGHLITDTSLARVADTGPSLKEAVRMRAFWLIGLAGMFQFTAVHAVTIHTVPYLTSLGMDRETAAVGVTIFSMVGLGTRIGYGLLADKFGKKYIYALSNAVTTVALVLLGALDGGSFFALALFGVVYGLGVSGASPLRTPIAREYFGVRHFGAIFGMLSIFTVIGGTTGAPLAGWVYDSTGGYFPIWYIFSGLTLAGTALVLMLPKTTMTKDLPGLLKVKGKR